MTTLWIILLLAPAQEVESFKARKSVTTAGKIISDVVPVKRMESGQKDVSDVDLLAQTGWSFIRRWEQQAAFQAALPPSWKRRLSDKRSPRSIKLDRSALEEIRRIRDQVGQKVLGDLASEQEFSRQLNGIIQPMLPRDKTGPATKTKVSPKPRIRPASRPQTRTVSSDEKSVGNSETSDAQPVVETVRVSPAMFQSLNRSPRLRIGSVPESRRHPEANETTSQATTAVLIDAIGQLDRHALELERSGEFSESGKMRKLSRKIRKQLLEMANRRDN